MSARSEVLDHGYVSPVETWGSDERIVEAARMSTQRGFEGWGPIVDDEKPCVGCDGAGVTDDRGFPLRGQPFFDTMKCKACGGDKKARKPGDEKLLRFLWTNKHATPFEMAGATIEIQAPIFVFREWHRHRTQSYNEASARYAPLPALDYVPSAERLLAGGGHLTNKQSSGTSLSADTAAWFRDALAKHHAATQALYEEALARGVAKELARIPLSVGRYSRMRASANLRNWLAFLTLRMAPNAQEEIRVYANAVHALLTEAFPRTLALFDEGRS
ncbi:MAG: hypothetical protein NVS3B10_00330 [Polyangiales bacterium]